MSAIEFKFTGRLADNHELNFYEAGRFQYAAARLIYTLEKFRQKGVVVSRLGSRVLADIRIKAPLRGSFVESIVQYAAPAMAECAINCSLEALFTYVWNLILPASTSDAENITVALSKQETERARLQVGLEHERTQQMRLFTSIARSHAANEGELISVLGYAVRHGLTTSYNGRLVTTEEIARLKDDVAARAAREKIIRENEEALAAIHPETERRLAGQVRKTIGDIVLPLKSSADGLTISSGDTHPTKIAELDEKSADQIIRVTEDEAPSLIRGKVKSYDRENGCGKFRYGDLRFPIPFRIPKASRDVLHRQIVSALNKEEVLLNVYFTRDAYGNPISLTIDDVRDDDDGR